ncbi:MAG: hypothetical protein LBJ37_13745 [Paucimonas sp.]|jgi:hypothetical protein|nr:hypothetical protein [Paucimonas sp.]
MKPGMLSIVSILAMTVSYCTGSYAENNAPERCFQTHKDWEVYTRNGDEVPQNPVPSATTGQYAMGFYKLGLARGDYAHGPAKRKAIIINTTSSRTDNLVTIDASGSTTPGGKIEFAWGNDPTNFRAGDSKATTEVAGSSGTVSILLIVKDPVCGKTESKQVVATYN